MRVAPYGTWTSPLSAATVAAAGLRLGAVQLDGTDVYWLEGRPQEGGRYALVKCSADGTITDVTPRDINVRTRVHEYGGGAYLVVDGVVYCSNFGDQRIYRCVRGICEAITPEGVWFYADVEFDRRRKRVFCVREDHTGNGEAVNTLVAIASEPPDGGPHGQEVIASGYDFYSTPRLSPDGSTLAWLCWRHPNMPWDGTELWVAEVDKSGALSDQRCVAGSQTESVYQPGWSPDGVLYFVSDRTGYWQLYRTTNGSNVSNVVNVSNDSNAPNGSNVEFGRAQWVFGTSTWTCAGPSRLVASYTRAGRWYLATIDLGSGRLTDLAREVEPSEWIAANATHAVAVAGSATRPDRVVRITLATGDVETLREAAFAEGFGEPRRSGTRRRASSLTLDEASISVAEAIEFPTGSGLTAHAFYYPPRNGDFEAPAGEQPPLIVISHGGPTAAAKATFDPQIQYWTTRGFAVVDVNYGGSTGYGRAYRERLNGAWGIVDVADVINAARFLADQGRADGERLAIRGGSAGGFTTLAALTFHPGVFKAGASYYGVSDLEVLDLDTHKFESRYSHTLVGPYPAAKEIYRARSPIHAIDRLSCPLILFQGLEDRIVPPNQSEMMAAAVRARGLPVAYLAFEGEQHGFRKADTIIRSLEAELYFYGKVFGFTPADAIAPVTIDNLSPVT
jgi:dienelactone hydrolase